MCFCFGRLPVCELIEASEPLHSVFSFLRWGATRRPPPPRPPKGEPFQFSSASSLPPPPFSRPLAMADTREQAEADAQALFEAIGLTPNTAK